MIYVFVDEFGERFEVEDKKAGKWLEEKLKEKGLKYCDKLVKFDKEEVLEE